MQLPTAPEQMFSSGETVRVTVNWLNVPDDARGEVIGFIYREPVTYVVRFPDGRRLIPGVHLERVSTD